MYATRFKVEGSGQFAFDMLRYDGCFPATESETGRMMARGHRQVELLVQHRERTHNCLTDERWRSFGWKIVDTEQPFKVS